MTGWHPGTSKALVHREVREDYWKVVHVVSPGVRQKLKEKALSPARKNGLPILGKRRTEKGTFLTYRRQKIALDVDRSPTSEGDSRAAMLPQTTHNDVHTSAKPRKGLHMSTMPHYAPTQAAPLRHPSSVHQALLHDAPDPDDEPTSLRFQVVPAGNAFFHIKEISTGHVRGFRSNHNEACALARALEWRS